MKNKDRIDVLKKYVSANENIVQVYKSEFEAGTRTFVDILDAETVLYEAKKSLVNREYELYSNYYDLLNSLSMLSPTILESESQSCSADIVPKTTAIPVSQTIAINKIEEETVASTTTNTTSDELNALLGDIPAEEPKIDTLVEENVTTVEPIILPADPIEVSSFLQAPTSAYTLNITTTKGLESANTFVSNNGLDTKKAYTYEFGPGMKSAKVIYGIFNSVKEAKAAMEALPASVIATKPYIDNISKHQKLYAKYH